jgi:hypothetical protein
MLREGQVTVWGWRIHRAGAWRVGTAAAEAAACSWALVRLAELRLSCTWSVESFLWAAHWAAHTWQGCCTSLVCYGVQLPDTLRPHSSLVWGSALGCDPTLQKGGN